jgi:hypothetical protein
MAPTNGEDDDDDDPVAHREDGIDELEETVPLVERSLTIELSPLDRREVCPAHGWVGRAAFQRDRHDLCIIEEEETVEIVETSIDETDPNPRVTLPGTKRRRIRNPAVARPRSISVKGISRDDLRLEEAKISKFTATREYAELIANRPKTRGDCKDGQRPCPWISCKQNLFLDVNGETGTIQLNFPGREIDQLPATCVLDVADEGTHTLEECGELTNRTRERIRQIEVRALLKLRVIEVDRED